MKRWTGLYDKVTEAEYREMHRRYNRMRRDVLETIEAESSEAEHVVTGMPLRGSNEAGLMATKRPRQKQGESGDRRVEPRRRTEVNAPTVVTAQGRQPHDGPPRRPTQPAAQAPRGTAKPPAS